MLQISFQFLIFKSQYSPYCSCLITKVHKNRGRWFESNFILVSVALEQISFYMSCSQRTWPCWPDMPLFICGFTATVLPPVRMNNSFNVKALSEKWVMNSLALFHNHSWCHRPNSHSRHRHRGEEKLLDAERCAGVADVQGEMEQKNKMAGWKKAAVGSQRDERERESWTAKKWRSRQIEIVRREWPAGDLEWLVRRAEREEEYLFCLLIEIQDAWSQPCCSPTASPAPYLPALLPSFHLPPSVFPWSLSVFSLPLPPCLPASYSPLYHFALRPSGSGTQVAFACYTSRQHVLFSQGGRGEAV